MKAFLQVCSQQHLRLDLTADRMMRLRWSDLVYFRFSIRPSLQWVRARLRVVHDLQENNGSVDLSESGQTATSCGVTRPGSPLGFYLPFFSLSWYLSSSFDFELKVTPRSTAISVSAYSRAATKPNYGILVEGYLPIGPAELFLVS